MAATRNEPNHAPHSFLLLIDLHGSFDLVKLAYLWYVKTTDCSDHGILETAVEGLPWHFSRAVGELLDRDNYLLVIMCSSLD